MADWESILSGPEVAARIAAIVRAERAVIEAAKARVGNGDPRVFCKCAHCKLTRAVRTLTELEKANG